MRLPDGPDRRPIYRQGVGGDTSNAIIAAARQGAKTGYISAVGGDPLGNDLMQLWAREGVCTDQVKIKPQDPTGAYFVNPHPSGRQFSYARRGSAASHLAPGDLDETRIQNAQILHVSAISLAVSSSMRHAAFKACRLAKDAGVKVSLDTNLRLTRPSLFCSSAVKKDLSCTPKARNGHFSHQRSKLSTPPGPAIASQALGWPTTLKRQTLSSL